MSKVTSPRNPRVQAARRLRRRPHRDREGAFLVEGPAALTEALDAGAPIREVFAGPDAPEGVLAAAERASVPILRVADRTLAQLCDTATPQGVAAVVEMRPVSLDDVLDSGSLIVVLAGVGDPGNAGTLLRSALAAGADAVVFLPGTVDPYHPKTVRAGAGALFALQIVRDAEPHSTLESLRAAGFSILGADMHAEHSHTEADLTGKVAVVLGNEAWGLPADLARGLTGTVKIRMPGPMESLNVGIAGSILLFEAVRQREASG